MMKAALCLITASFLLSGCCAYGPQAKRGTVKKAPVNRTSDVIETTKTDKGIEIRLKGDVSFDTRSSELSGRAEKVLDELAAEFVKKDYRDIKVVGHTDNRGGDAYNMRLSRDRAQSVRNRLVAGGVKGSRVETDGKGPTEPIASNDTEEGRAKNRRVEILIED